ncbi:MAG: FtsW/RodA/SpoVE family cell cycle protein [Deinococcales bacterium]
MLKPLHPLLFALQLLLLALGALAVATAAPSEVPSTGVFIVLSLVVTFLVAQLRAGASIQLGKYAWILCLLALVAVLVFDKRIGGVRRWIEIGGFHMQPSEFAKIALIAYFASFFARRGARYALWVPALALGLTSVLILLAPSTSAAIFTFFLGLGVMFLANAPIGRIMSIALTAGIVSLPLFILYIQQNSYVANRLEGFTITLRSDDLCYKPDKSQVEFARCVIERGGNFGRGPAQVKFEFPADTNDFVASTVAHSLGLFGITTIFAAFGCILWIGLDLMQRLSEAVHIESDERNAASILCGGGMLLLVAQAMINLAVTVGRFPNTGMTLPFVSDGGSSMVTCAIAIGWMHTAYALLKKHQKTSVPRPILRESPMLEAGD